MNCGRGLAGESEKGEGDREMQGMGERIKGVGKSEKGRRMGGWEQ